MTVPINTAIVSTELFEKVQKRLAEDKKKYRHPNEKQLLSNLVECGVCKGSCTGSRRFIRSYYKGVRTGEIYHRTAYVCTKTIHQKAHSKNVDMERCTNAQVSAPRLEAQVFFLLKEVVANEARLRQYLVLPKDRKRTTKVPTELQLKEVEHEIEKLMKAKKEALRHYARKDITSEEYKTQCQMCDSAILKARNERTTLLETIPVFQKENVIEASVRSYCDTLKMRLAVMSGFDSQRDLVLEYIERISFAGNNMEVRGTVPVLSQTQDQRREIKFVIKSEIPPRYRGGKSSFLSSRNLESA